LPSKRRTPAAAPAGSGEVGLRQLFRRRRDERPEKSRLLWVPQSDGVLGVADEGGEFVQLEHPVVVGVVLLEEAGKLVVGDSQGELLEEVSRFGHVDRP